MKSTEQTRITLTKVKYAAFASQETLCFEAVVCFDDRPVCRVSNDGHGGADHVYPLKGSTGAALADAMAPMETFIGTLEGWTIDHGPMPGCAAPVETVHPHTLETVVGDLMNVWLVARDFDRAAKKNLLYTRSDKPGIWQIKAEPAQHPELINKMVVRQPTITYTFLNTLPRAEALRLFRGAA